MKLEKLGVVGKYELLKHLRRRRFYVVLALALAIEALILALLPMLGWGYPENVMVMAGLLSIGPSFATLGAVFFAGDAIAGEFEGKTGYILFPNPVGRATVVGGKFLACSLAVGLIVLLSYGVVGLSLLWIYGQVPAEVGSSLGLCLLLTCSVVAMTFFFSSVSKGTMGATVTTLIFLFVVLGVLESILFITGNPRWFLLSYAGDVVITVYGDYPIFGPGMEPEAIQPPDVVTSVGVMLAYLAGFFVLSLAITKRREML